MVIPLVIPHYLFLEAGLGSNSSFIWSSIRESQSLIRAGSRVCVGKGTTVRVWGEPWLPDSSNPYISTPVMNYLGNPLVNSLFIPNTLTWDREVVKDIFNARDARIIMGLPTSNSPVRDSWFWGGGFVR